MVQCMPDMSKSRRVDWVLEKADVACIEWLRTKATDTVAEHISDLVSALEFWSDRVPKCEMQGFRPAASGGQLNAVREVICYACGGRGHYQSQCPKRTEPGVVEVAQPRRPYPNYLCVQT